MKVKLYYYHLVTVADDRGRSPEEFRVCARRFIHTYRKFDPGCDHDLVATFLRGEPTPDDVNIYADIPVQFQTYWPGIIGRHLLEEARKPACDFIVHIISRAYFHQSGWLKRLVDARVKHGPGIYGTMTSNWGSPLGDSPGHNPHIRGSIWAADCSLLSQYPHDIKDVRDEYRMECGEWNLALWFESMKAKAMLVTWDGEWDRPDWDKPENTFLKGSMKNLLNWDRHTDSFGYSRPLEGGPGRMDCCTDYEHL